MVHRKKLLKAAKTAGVLALILLLTAAGDAQAGKKKKKKKKSHSTTVESQLLTQIDSRLVAYKTAEARALLEAEMDPQDVDVVLARGRVLEQEKSYDEAAAELQRIADLAPADPAALVYLGECQLHADRSKAARDAFAAAEQRAAARLAEDPDHVRSLYFQGVAQQRLQRYEEAVATLQRARELAPKDEMVVYQLGVTYAFQENWGAAIDHLSQALAKNSGIAYAYYYRGLSHGKVGRKDLMLNDLDRFLALAPEAPEAGRARRVLEAG